MQCQKIQLLPKLSDSRQNDQLERLKARDNNHLTCSVVSLAMIWFHF